MGFGYCFLVGNKGISILNQDYMGTIFPYSLLRTGKLGCVNVRVRYVHLFLPSSDIKTIRFFLHRKTYLNLGMEGQG